MVIGYSFCSKGTPFYLQCSKRGNSTSSVQNSLVPLVKIFLG